MRFKSVNLLVKVKVSLKANGRHGNALLQVRFPRFSAWHRVWLSGYMVEFGDGCIMDDHYRFLKPYSKTQWNSLNILKLGASFLKKPKGPKERKKSKVARNVAVPLFPRSLLRSWESKATSTEAVGRLSRQTGTSLPARWLHPLVMTNIAMENPL